LAKEFTSMGESSAFSTQRGTFDSGSDAFAAPSLCSGVSMPGHSVPLEDFLKSENRFNWITPHSGVLESEQVSESSF